jgi:hypothetical protein
MLIGYSSTFSGEGGILMQYSIMDRPGIGVGSQELADSQGLGLVGEDT